MDIKNTPLPALTKKLKKLESQVSDCFPLIIGSVTVIGGRNKLPRFSINKRGKKTSMYLGKNKERIARKYLENYHRLCNTIDAMADINLELIRRMEVPRAKKSA
jgi:hypothetical protein